MFQFDSINDFLMMDGHGIYVWACYAITLAAFIVLAWLPFAKKRELVTQLQRQERINNRPAEVIK